MLFQFLGDLSMSDVAPMPDTYCHTPEGSWSAPCHFVNMPRNATQFEWSDCEGCCVVKAINNYTGILGDEVNSPFICPTGEDSDEPCPLIFLIHYVGDCHQPLHIGYLYDKGGNDVSVTFFGEATELHAVWDTAIIEKWDRDYEDATKELETIMSDNPDVVKKYISEMNPIDWADESFDFVRTVCYNFTSENGVGEIGEAYYDDNLPIIKYRLIAAGVRLGTLLNTILEGSNTKQVYQVLKELKRYSDKRRRPVW